MDEKHLESQLSRIYTIAEQATDFGVAHLTGESTHYNGREVVIHGKTQRNFASCSYLGLSLDPRVIEGAIDGTRRFGTSFPTSRSFLTQGYLHELEEKLAALFGHPCIVTSSTSLAHTAFLPIFITKNDVIICDHQVHTSVQVASEIVRAKGCVKDVVRHNDLQALEAKIIDYSKTHRHVWYLADGVYSMYGDKAPIKRLNELLNQYENFHVYVDDAHGMSWTGDNGKGYVLGESRLHPRMVLSTSLGKAFGSIGGVLVCNNPKLKQIIKSCGSAFIFSSPLPPSVIGASIASAEIHLTPEIKTLQSQLHKRIAYFKSRASHLGLPLLGQGDSPIFFIPSGNPETCFKIVQQMMEAGFYQSSAVYPSVPYHNAGVRFTLTNWLELEDIDHMLTAFRTIRQEVLRLEQLSEDDIKRKFKGILYTLDTATAMKTTADPVS